MLLAPPPPTLHTSAASFVVLVDFRFGIRSKEQQQDRLSDAEQRNSRQLHIDLPCRAQPILKHRVVKQLQARLHTVESSEL